MTLKDYISTKYGGSQAAFAQAQGVQRQQITQWLKKNFIVIDDIMYSERRKLK